MGNQKSIGIAYSDQDLYDSDTIYAKGTLGYSRAGQGSVTQLTNKATAVTLNKSAGQITMNNASLATVTNVTFTLNNSLISANDTLIVTVSSGGTSGAYNCWVSGLAAGSASITVRNISAGPLSEAVVLNFALIHCE